MLLLFLADSGFPPALSLSLPSISLRAVAAGGRRGRKGRRESGQAGEVTAVGRKPRAAAGKAAGRELAAGFFFFPAIFFLVSLN